MAGLKTFIVILYGSIGLFMAAIAVPLIRRKVGPNPFYGFRVPKTLADPEVWYEANAFAGTCFFWLGLAISLVCVALYTVPMDGVVYALVCLTITMVGLAVCLILSFLYLKRLGD